MYTKEGIEDEIFNLKEDIFKWFADLAPYFTDAISFKDVVDDELPYFRNIDNIIRICHIDEVYQDQGEESILIQFNLRGFQPPFTYYRAIQYKNGYYLIDMYKLALDYSEEYWEEKELEIEDLYSLIYALIRMYNN